MINLFESQIVQILPESIAGKSEVKALSFALGNAIMRLLEFTWKTRVYAIIDELEDEYLDLLALEFNTQYYDTSLPTATKRELVKNTFVWYESAGTAKTVEELVTIIFGEGSVSEWFEYGDDPYYFKVLTNAQQTPEILEQFTRIIERAKNVRSSLRTIEIHREIEQPEYIGIGVVGSPEIHITNAPQLDYALSQKQGIGVGVISTPHITIRGNNATKAEAAASVRAAAAVVASPHIVIASGS